MPRNFDYDRTPADIIMACQSRSHEPYMFQRNNNLYRNRDLLELFGEREFLRIDELTPRMQEVHARDKYSEGFEAKRAGELIRWGMDHEVLAQETVDRRPAWRLLDREMQYLLVGPATRQREIRFRGLKDQVELVEANKLAYREYKRRDRATAKQVERQREAVTRNLERVLQVSPEEPLPESLDRFRVEGHGLLRSYREVLIDAVADEDGWKVVSAIAETTLAAVAVFHTAKIAERKAAAEAPAVPDDDADALGSMDL
jgi:hypothetical protein